MASQNKILEKKKPDEEEEDPHPQLGGK